MMEFQMAKNQEKDEAELEWIKRMWLRGELPPEEEEEEEDWAPDSILTAQFANDGSDWFYITSQGQYAGYYYKCSLDKERPIKAVPLDKGFVCTYLEFSPSNEYVMAGCDNGEVFIWSVESEKKAMWIKKHDGHRGHITSVKMNWTEDYLLTTGQDGIVISHLIDKDAIKMVAQVMPPGETSQFAEQTQGIEEMNFDVEVRCSDKKIEDIVDPE